MAEKNPKPQEKSKLDDGIVVRAEGAFAPDRPDTNVRLKRSSLPLPDNAWFWGRIRKRAIDFNRYKEFIDNVMCCGPLPEPKRGECPDDKTFDLRLPFPGVQAYTMLKVATELYLMQECGLCRNNLPTADDLREDEARLDQRIDEIQAMRDRYLEDLFTEAGSKGGPLHDIALPYLAEIRRKLSDLPLKGKGEFPANCYGILFSRVANPCLLELIWSYWHEEGMLVQSMNAIMRRFQNLRSTGATDPLANLEIDPLRPLNNLLWGHIQDEQHRLTITRRVYEYDHHYGLRLVGKAVPELRTADSRSKFLEGFHNLLHACTIFFQQDDDTTVIADGFPVLNALREVHLTLAQGAHNQFGDLPWTSRIEMLMEMWLLARPEIREFLRGRIMVPYPEPWMDAVDHMKKIQSWTDNSIREFRDLGVFGEQLVLSIRYDNWAAFNDANLAANWARYWRQEIQRYIHSYRAVTGVDLNQEPVNATMPALLLQRRLAAQAAAAR